MVTQSFCLKTSAQTETTYSLLVLPPEGKKDNGSGHFEINVFLFSSITDSDAHIRQTSPTQLPTDPSGCLDMMRGGV